MLLGDSHQLPPIYKEENRKEEEDSEASDENITMNLLEILKLHGKYIKKRKEKK